MNEYSPVVTRLSTPVRISEHSWPEGSNPVVSVCCCTFNHGKFLREALNSFLKQETTFPVEIIVHDDASSDDTTEIAREYALQHPRLFRLILQSENQWQNGRLAMCITIGQARGDFIALCEGDDYWTSLDKLQHQVEALEANPDILLSFHAHKEVDEHGNFRQRRDPRTPVAGILAQGAYFQRQCEAFQTASFVIRRQHVKTLPEWYDQLAWGWDVCLIALASLRGRLHSLEGCHSCYRIHDGGIMGSQLLTMDAGTKARDDISRNESFAALFELLIHEAPNKKLSALCRAYSMEYLKDVIWCARLNGNQKIIKRTVFRAFKLAPFSFMRSAFMWKCLASLFIHLWCTNYQNQISNS